LYEVGDVCINICYTSIIRGDRRTMICAGTRIARNAMHVIATVWRQPDIVGGRRCEGVDEFLVVACRDRSQKVGTPGRCDHVGKVKKGKVIPATRWVETTSPRKGGVLKALIFHQYCHDVGCPDAWGSCCRRCENRVDLVEVLQSDAVLYDASSNISYEKTVWRRGWTDWTDYGVDAGHSCEARRHADDLEIVVALVGGWNTFSDIKSSLLRQLYLPQNALHVIACTTHNI